MSKVLPPFKKALLEDLLNSVSANISHYYAVATNPVAITGPVQEVANNDYTEIFNTDWNILFGKQLKNNNFAPVIAKKFWSTNTVYNRYDNTSDTIFSNNGFYVISKPAYTGGEYLVYKCIDNANGSVSTTDPGSIGTPKQISTFKTSDGYKWKYVGYVSGQNYSRFATNDYIPIYPDYNVSSAAASYSSVEVVMISNSGSGYGTYVNGAILSVQNTTVVEIGPEASIDNNYYNRNGIYIYNDISATSQIFEVSKYVVDSYGRKFVYLDQEANTTNITAGVTKYFISPKVLFETDGSNQPKAYSTINAASNSINSIVILDTGSNISWANVKIQSNTAYGSGANLYAIVPPAGGHGADPVSELDVKGIAVAFSFNNTESGSIVTSNALYNKIAIIKDPYALNANGEKASTRYTSNTFSNILKGNAYPTHTFNVGEQVIGQTTGSRGTVVFSNSSTVYLAGDKSFANNEYIANNQGTIVGQLNIATLGDVYTKDLNPLYVKNINNVNRLDSQTESFKLIIQI